jgi:predicted Rossmann fold nucleotide-binding protein DprA/Smf involved in DNA uptake
MKELDVFLKTVVDGMKVMAQGVESLAEKLDGIAKARLEEKAKAKPARKAPAKPKKKVAKKAAKKPVAKKPVTAVGTVLKIINRSKKGVSPSTLMEKTGFAPQKVHNIVYNLKKQGKIKSVGRGVYLKG